MTSPIHVHDGSAPSDTTPLAADRASHSGSAGTSGPRPAARAPRADGAHETSWLRSKGPLLCRSFADFAAVQLTLHASAVGATCYRLAPCGELRVDVSDVLSGLCALGFRVLRDNNGGSTVSLVADRGFAEIDSLAGEPVRVLTLDGGQLEPLRERLAAWIRPASEDGPGVLHMLQLSCGDLEFAPLGAGGRPLRRENYGPAVLEAVDHVVSDIDATDPCGRMVLLTGAPGTGKTHIVRGILATATRPRFIVLQPGEIRQFLDASPLSALRSFSRGEAKGRPIVLIIEDADECLLPRGTDNISQISALLNLSDGLVGSMFDIRILATTNARHIDIDPAIMRAGRMCRRVDVLPLEAGHATRLLASLRDSTTPTTFSKPVALADVYAAARAPGPDGLDRHP